MRVFLRIFLLSTTVAICTSNSVADSEWQLYKLIHTKTYPSVAAENNARFYYAVNKDRVLQHNKGYAGGTTTFQLAVNQFSDMRFVDFAARFPPTTAIPSNGVPYTPPTAIPQASFDYASQGFSSPVQDQGQVCNSGWAYATATALQIFQGTITGNLNTAPLSAQNFIDCTGGAKACVNQVPQIAFDYLTMYGQQVFPLSEYPNQPTIGQGMCLRPPNSLNGVGLTSYSNIPNGNDALLKSIVNYVAPVVFTYNPGSFEMMHYKQGVFTQAPTQSASHPMTVVGYGTDLVTNLDYWLVQNSWGTTWGESGFIRIHRDPSKPIAISAIFPSN